MRLAVLALALSLSVALAVPSEFFAAQQKKLAALDDGPVGPTFSAAIPGKWYRGGSENELINYKAVTGQAALTHFWMTGDGQCDDVTIKIFVDGETSPSIEFTPSMAAGVGYDDETAPWGTDLTGKGAYTGGWYSNTPTPFGKSLRITFTAPKDAVLWFIARGSEGYETNLRGIKLPSEARLKLVKYSGHNQPLDYVELAKAEAGVSGLIYQTTLAVKSGNLNFLEGCYRIYTNKDMKYPGVLLSSGTEDFYSSAFYYDGGPFHVHDSGLTHLNGSDGTYSSYRFLDRDPIFFHDGMSFLWRLGDTDDPVTGMKCVNETGGNMHGTPLASDVAAYTWIYEWPSKHDKKDSMTAVTIGTSLSQGTLTKEEKVLFEHTVTSGAKSSAMTQFWMTSCDDQDDAIISYYVDGETTPSISFQTSLATGVVAGTGEEIPWGTRSMGHGAKTGAWVNKFLIPFGKSIKITYQLPPTASVDSSCFYAIVRGLENMPLQVGAVALPSSARLRLHKVESKQLADFEWVPLVDLKQGSGMLFLTTMAVQSGDLNFLEGCVHAYTSADMPWPGVLLSTGTEDFFDSAYYYDAGEFHSEVSGLTHLEVNSTYVSYSSYRFQQYDPVTFHKGFKLMWRNGDKTDGQGVKCFIQDSENGIPAGKAPRLGLTPSVLTSYAWTYEWADNVENDPQVEVIGTGMSNVPVVANKETDLFSSTLAKGDTGVMTHFWVTGTAGHDDTIIRYYIDGESAASLQFVVSEAAGVGFGDETAPWNAGSKMGKGAHTGAWWFNFPIPFTKSVRVTFQAARDGIIYAIVRGATNLPVEIGKDKIRLPAHARLQAIKTVSAPGSLDYVTLAALPKASKGLIYMTSMIIESGNLNCLEGCFRYYPTRDITYPGVLLSSGSEDYWNSAFYFNAGTFRFAQSGLTHMDTSNGAKMSAYYFHDSDPLYFSDGFEFVWRNGETMPDDGVNTKCLNYTGGKPIGTPTASNVTAYTWVYTY